MKRFEAATHLYFYPVGHAAIVPNPATRCHPEYVVDRSEASCVELRPATPRAALLWQWRLSGTRFSTLIETISLIVETSPALIFERTLLRRRPPRGSRSHWIGYFWPYPKSVYRLLRCTCTPATEEIRVQCPTSVCACQLEDAQCSARRRCAS